MELLLSILLYLGIITTGATYTQGEIDSLVHTNHDQVESVSQDPVLSVQVLTDNQNNVAGMIEPDTGEE